MIKIIKEIIVTICIKNGKYNIRNCATLFILASLIISVNGFLFLEPNETKSIGIIWYQIKFSFIFLGALWLPLSTLAILLVKYELYYFLPFILVYSIKNEK